MATTAPTAQTPLSEDQITRWRERIRQTTFANYHFEMGLALLESGNAEAAVTALERAVEIQPDLADAYPILVRAEEARGRADAAKARKSEIAARAPHLWGRGCVGLAMRHYRNEDLDKAEAWLAQAAAIAPDHGLLRACAGLLHVGRERYAEACSEFDRVTAVLETDDIAGEIADALVLHAKHKFLDRAPPQPDKTLVVLAAARAAMRLDPQRTELQEFIVLGSIRLGRFEDALREMERLPAQRAVDKEVKIQAGVAYLSLGDYARATRALDECVALDPNWSRPFTFLGLVALATGDVARGMSLLRNALEKGPQEPFAMSSFGLALHASGRLEEAVRVHRDALAIAPGDQWALVNLGLALEALGDEAGGRAAYRAALENASWYCFVGLNMRPFGGDRLKQAFADLGFPVRTV